MRDGVHGHLRAIYIKSQDDGLPYLVNMKDDGANVQFFQLVDANGDDLAQDGEYKQVPYSSLPNDLKSFLPEPAAGNYTDQLQNFANWFTYHRKRRSAARMPSAPW